MTTEYIAYDNNYKIKISSDCPKKAVAELLEASKTRTIKLRQYIDGQFKMTIGGEGVNYLNLKFTRKEAKEYCKPA